MKTKWKLGLLILFLILSGGLVFGGGAKEKDAAVTTTKAEPIKIKLSHSATPISGQGQAAEYFKKLVEEQSKGAILVEHYPQCILSAGNAQRQLEMVISGAIEMSLETSAKYAFLDPRVEVISLPFMFRDMDHYYKALLSPTILKPIGDKLETKGMHVVNWHPRVPRQFMNRIKAVRTPSDMEGLRVRTMSGPVYIQTFASIGAKPTPLDWAELYTALELKVVDAIEPDLASFNQMKFYETTKFVTKWDYSMDAYLEVYSKKFWDSLSEANRDLLVKASKESWDFTQAMAVKMDNEALEEMKKMGLKVEILSAQEKAAFAEKTRPVWDVFMKKNGREIVDAILALK